MKHYISPYAEWIMLGNGTIHTEDPLTASTDNDLPWDWIMSGQIVNRGRDER